MGIHNKTILTGRVRKLEESVARLNKVREDQDDILKRILSQQDRILKILESMTDGEAYHKFLKEQEKEE
jgi:flagellar motility protein MotE (MotC chaperone)